MKNSKNWPLPAYPVANFPPSSSSEANTIRFHSTGKDKLKSEQKNEVSINPATDVIPAYSRVTGLATIIAAQSRPAILDVAAVENDPPWWRRGICRNLLTFDVLFSVSVLGSFVGAIYVLAKII